MAQETTSHELNTAAEVSMSSIENIRRKMILMEIMENEKSRFDDDLETKDEWNETNHVVTRTDDVSESVGETLGYSEIPSEWTDQVGSEHDSTIAQDDLGSPRSYYQLMELNKDPVDHNTRIVRVPSQYELDELSENFFFDFPKQINYKCINAPRGQELTDRPTNLLTMHDER
ncbi:unnamed protein product [Caenorhabditis bovis]|uniref:Uncharacterized protein n=1 Tax=Caenorhabditis bovis TaxID=2654633 RepID=A0A8S1EUU0_9PELO|nr:unnamed protein product [Caenorhabditis bovis]